MATYSTNLRLTLLATGEGAGTWGDTANTNMGTLLEQAISGYETQALTSGTTLTLTIPDNGASAVARNMYLEFTGDGSTVIVPSNKKLYFVYNNCSSGTITMKVAGQTGVTVANGQKQILVSNGTDIVEAISAGLEGETIANLTALGVNAGNSVTSGNYNTAIGYNAGTAVTSGSSNTFLGYEAGLPVTTGNFNTQIGYSAGAGAANASANTFIGYLNGYNIGGSNNVSVGHAAMQGTGPGSSNSAAENTAVGFQALNVVSSAGACTVMGYQAGDSITSGSWNTLVGHSSGNAITSSVANTACGYNTLRNITTSGSNTALGDSAYVTGNYSNSTCLGAGTEVTGSNQVQLGSSSTTTYVYGTVQNRSDERDKADIQDTQLGLGFIMALQPRQFRWDYREDYRPPMPGPDATKEEWAAYSDACKLENLTHNGSKKRNRFHQGLIAQEVKQTMDAMGVDFGGYQDHKINGGQDVLSIGYEEMIAPLIKAIQELKAEFDEYKRTHP